ncbi:MAG: ABC-type uncharacterized transport system substrate-binding protein [Alphaproteobacteria bacterium]
MKHYSCNSGPQRLQFCLLFGAIFAGALFTASPSEAARCLFVSSYHKGYAWSDGVERGLRSILAEKCELKQFDMDTKRKKPNPEKVAAGLAAKALIESWRPDVVITADDNTAKYLIQPHYKNRDVPFVFCGINWTVKEYGFPYANATGMIEVALIRPLLKRAISISGGGRSAFYIGAETLSERKNLKRFQDATQKLGIKLQFALVATREDWLKAHQRAQESDFVIIGSNAGINNWDKFKVFSTLIGQSRKLSVTNHAWMMPYTLLGITKVPEEQGEWAGKVALKILEGAAPSSIPIVANSRRAIWLNDAILKVTSVSLPNHLKQKAKRVKGLE